MVYVGVEFAPITDNGDLRSVRLFAPAALVCVGSQIQLRAALCRFSDEEGSNSLSAADCLAVMLLLLGSVLFALSLSLQLQHARAFDKARTLRSPSTSSKDAVSSIARPFSANRRLPATRESRG